MVEVSNQWVTILKSEHVPFQWGKITGQHIFLLVKSAPIHLIGGKFLKTHDIHVSFSRKGEMYLELNKSDSELTGKIIILKEAPQEETVLETDWTFFYRTFQYNFSSQVGREQVLILKQSLHKLELSPTYKVTFFNFLKRVYFFIFRERRREEERGRDTSMCGCLSYTPNWGPGPQPMHVTWQGIELVTLWFAG